MGARVVQGLVLLAVLAGAAEAWVRFGLGLTPGPLVDAHAPPPPPGSTPATHPALSGSCGGDPVGCSEAGTAVRAAATFDDAVAALRKLGFDVEPR